MSIHNKIILFNVHYNPVWITQMSYTKHNSINVSHSDTQKHNSLRNGVQNTYGSCTETETYKYNSDNCSQWAKRLTVYFNMFILN